MSKISVNLQKDREFLLDCLRKAQKEKELSQLVNDLFTEEEISDLAQRLKIARGIVQEKTYQEVSDKVDASTSTVTKIGQVIKYGRGAFEKLFARPAKPEGRSGGGEKHGS